MRRFQIIAVLALMLAGCGIARAQEEPAPAPEAEVDEGPAPAYEARLLRLAEILGSVQFLRTLCRESEDRQWLNAMQMILESETSSETERRKRLTAGYNRGFRAFAAVYSGCTPAAVAAETRYREEGAALASEIVARFGN